MADAKISALTDGSSLRAGDLFPIDRSGSNSSIKGGNIPGFLLAVAQYAPGTLSTYSVSSSALTALDTTNLTVSFTVPASTNVVVKFSAVMAPAASGVLGLGLLNHSGGAQLGKTLSTAMSGGAPAGQVTAAWYLTGLSAGTLGIDIAAGSSAGTANVYAQGATGAVNGSNAGPAVLTVWAA